ncbi:MAG: acyl-CoA thioesterase [Chloroflexi bacterium]|nr:acyl-CoA thioesterase [Chloroflexota bacterium]
MEIGDWSARNLQSLISNLLSPRGIIPFMHNFRFYHPIEVRYGDLDPQGHVNNARYLTYMEQARVNYVRAVGMWDGGSFLHLGIIMADARITFKSPILWGQTIRVGVSIVRLGRKSMDSIYSIEDTQSGRILADGSSVLVAYDYKSSSTIPIPDHWRQIIADFENIGR